MRAARIPFLAAPSPNEGSPLTYCRALALATECTCMQDTTKYEYLSICMCDMRSNAFCLVGGSSWLISLVLTVGAIGSLSRWCSGSLSIALTRTGKEAANFAIAITIGGLPRIEKAVTTSVALLNFSVTPQAFASTWTHASPSGLRPLSHKETMRCYIEIAGIVCAWSAKGHLALHLEPRLHQNNIFHIVQTL